MLHRLISAASRLVTANRLQILIYHQVLADFDPIRPNEPTAAQFDWQMRLIKTHYHPLSLSAAITRLQQGRLPRNAVCITFDDGYLNNLEVAQPILAKYDIPATVYVATAFANGENMWNDRILHLFAKPQVTQLKLDSDGQTLALGPMAGRAKLANALLNQLKYMPLAARLQRVEQLYRLNPAISEQHHLMMTPEQVLALSRTGVEIGAHTHSHPILKILTPEQQRQEISQSRQLLQQWTGKPVQHFAYPNGVIEQDLSAETVAVVKDVGFDSAVVTTWGTASAQNSPYLLPRFTPWDKKPLRFHLRLLQNGLNNREIYTQTKLKRQLA